MFSHTIFGGEKDNWLIAFYGYGQSASVYTDLYEKIKDEYNLMVIDNPMHDYQQDIYPSDLKKYIQDILSENNVSTFQSISYSMGSRLNLYLPVLFPQSLLRIIIIAPDGITFNFWNRVAISTPWGRRIFKFFVENGAAYMNALLFFHKIGVVNKSLYAFSKWNMRDERRRKNVYNAWMNMRFLRPDLKEVNKEVENNNIELVSYFGKNDPVIPKAVQERCVKFFPTSEHNILDSDHNILNNELFNRILIDLDR